MIAHGLVQIARCKRHDRGKVCRRLIERQSGNHIDICVTAGHLQRAALLQHRHKHRGTVVIEAVAHAARNTLRRRRQKRLYFRQDRAHALHHAGHAGAGRVLGTTGKQHFRWIRNFDEPLAVHLEHADLIGGAEAVFRGAQDPMAHVRFAFKVQHAVYHVLKHLGTRNGAFLVDVTDHKNGDPLPFGKLHQLHCTVLDLRNAAGGRLQRLVVKRLDGVNDQNIRLFLADRREHVAKAGLRKHKQVSAAHRQSVGAHFELARRLLAGYI